MSEPPAHQAKRPYNSPARRQRVAETRERIVAAGAALVREFTTWDWDGLTFRAVAELAGISERTVYRHFPTERHLHDAVMARLEDEAGITYEDVELANRFYFLVTLDDNSTIVVDPVRVLVLA